jgi:hypothetical protein
MPLWVILGSAQAFSKALRMLYPDVDPAILICCNGPAAKARMGLQIEKPPPPPAPALALLRHCYRFVNEEWQHLPRDDSTDQGFEVKLRESCIAKLGGWVVSQHREMNLGMGLITASGVLHEIDIIAQQEPTVGILELKNRAGVQPEKNDVIVFFAKILDYLCLTPALLRTYLVPIFVSSYAFQQSGLAACLGLGIHPIAPQLRPLPVLLDNANRMTSEMDKGLAVPLADALAFGDFCARLANMSSLLAGADANSRFDYFNDLTIAVRAFGGVDVNELADELRTLNSECSRLIQVFRTVKGV